MEKENILNELLDGVNLCSEQLKIIQLRLRTFISEEKRSETSFRAPRHNSISDTDSDSIEVPQYKRSKQSLNSRSYFHSGGQKPRGRPKKSPSQKKDSAGVLKLTTTSLLHRKRGRPSLQQNVEKMFLTGNSDKINPFIESKILQKEISSKGSLSDDVITKESGVNDPDTTFNSEVSLVDKEVSEKYTEDHLYREKTIEDNNNEEYHEKTDTHLLDIPSNNSAECNSMSEKWWHSKQIWLEWKDSKNIGKQQSVSGRLLDEEPSLGEIALVHSSKSTSQKVYHAMVLEILD